MSHFRKRDRDAKDQASSGIAQKGANATSKCKLATAGVEVKPITRILPDEMETQPANINETGFASLMEPSLPYPEAEPSSDWLDTATTLEFPGVAGVAMQQLVRAATPEEPLEASASPTVDPEPYAAAMSLIAEVSDVEVVAIFSSIPATSGTATPPLAAAAAVEPRAVAAPAPLATLDLPFASPAPLAILGLPLEAPPPLAILALPLAAPAPLAILAAPEVAAPNACIRWDL